MVYPIRMIVTLFLAIWVYITPWFQDSNNEYPWSFFIAYAILNGVYSLVFSSLSLAKTLFFTQISDKTIGGTYMTLLNTISNIGVAWPATFALYLIDILSFKQCEGSLGSFHNSSVKLDKETYVSIMKRMEKNTCSTEVDIETCLKWGAQCIVSIDAFYTLTALALMFGMFWLYYYSKTMNHLQSLSRSNWRVYK